MAKKKKKQTPKDDLIDSLMNDVQEFNENETQDGKKSAQDVFLSDDENSGPKNVMIGLDSEENRIDDTNNAAVDLWRQVKDPDALAKDELKQENQYEAFMNAQEPPLPAYDDKTVNINEGAKLSPNEEDIRNSLEETEAPKKEAEESFDAERTVAVEGFANRQPKAQTKVAPKISFGSLRGPRPATTSGSVYASTDATLAQSESLKLAQQRVLELEREVEKYRQENEELASAGEIIRSRSEELTARIFALEKEKQEVYDSLQNELMIVKGTLQYKESEMGKARLKIEELEARLKSDFKKIRVRERELENRLELVKAEKSALLRAKDENILELKRKIVHLESELDNYRSKVLELNKTIDTNQEQFKRTVRALRLALSNLEVKEENVVPLKKAD